MLYNDDEPNDEIDDIEIITESLFALSPDDPFPNTVGTILNHDTIIGWEDLSFDAQNAVRLKYPTIESCTLDKKLNNEVYTTDCVTILCNLCSNYVKSFPLPCTSTKRSNKFYYIHKRTNCPEAKENKLIRAQIEIQNLTANNFLEIEVETLTARNNFLAIEVETLRTKLADAKAICISEISNLLGFQI